MAKKPTAAAQAATPDLVQLRLTRDHDHRVTPARVLAFKAGSEPWVDPETARAVIAAGAAEDITPITPQQEA